MTGQESFDPLTRDIIGLALTTTTSITSVIRLPSPWETAATALSIPPLRNT
jgi:hypothetical protein